MTDTVVAVRGLRKRYGPTLAVDDASFEVRQGEVFALLGPNGSGKTSTLESLEGLRRADGGSSRSTGSTRRASHRSCGAVIGVQLQTSALPPAMTVEETMRFFCAYHGVPTRSDLVERVGLSEKRRTPYGSSRRASSGGSPWPWRWRTIRGRLPRRAHGRSRRPVPRWRSTARRGAAGSRRDGGHRDARHGGGREARRPRGDPAAGPDRRGRQPSRADGESQPQDADFRRNRERPAGAEQRPQLRGRRASRPRATGT